MSSGVQPLNPKKNKKINLKPFVQNANFGDRAPISLFGKYSIGSKLDGLFEVHVLSCKRSFKTKLQTCAKKMKGIVDLGVPVIFE